MNKEIKNITACGIIPIYINENGEKEFLAIRQNEGQWSIPKGHVEEGETFLETAVRELQEETGLICTKINTENMITEKYIIPHPEKILNKTVHYFIGYVNTQDLSLQDEEIQDSLWGNAGRIMNKLTFDQAREVFQKALDILSLKEKDL